MAPRLRQDPFAGVHEDDRQIRRRCARDHVARVLFVTGGIRDDEFALLGGEVSVGNVDRYALFPLGGEPIDQQREVDILSLGADALAVGRQSGELVLKDHFTVVEQAADQR